jgi:hypothetical protein
MDFAVTVVSRPIRAAFHPPTSPPGSQEPTSVEATTCRDPGSVDCPGSIFVAVDVPTDILRACCYRVTPRGFSKRHGSSSHVGHEFALFQTMKAGWGDYERRWSGMAITPFLAGRTFEPDQITVMSAAFGDTCKALGLSEADHPLMPLVAQHVMELGQRGVKTRAVLYLLTLEEFRSYRQ